MTCASRPWTLQHWLQFSTDTFIFRAADLGMLFMRRPGLATKQASQLLFLARAVIAALTREATLAAFSAY